MSEPTRYRPAVHRRELVLDGSIPQWSVYLRELYGYREVALVMMRRDLIVRFRQTYFGIAWLLFKPLMMMLVISVAFGFIARFEHSSTVPYPLLVLCGVIPWYFFSNSVPDGMNSLVGHMPIIQKTYFPRLLVPLTSIAVNSVEFCVAWTLFGLACLWYGFLPNWHILMLPLFGALLVALCVGLSLWLSVLNARFRDVGNLVPFLLNTGFFVTPVGYTMTAVPERWAPLFMLNPLVGIIEGVRWCMLGSAFPFPSQAATASLVTSVLVLTTGLGFFRRTEGSIVDRA